jgi:hypothetical protein
MREPRASKAPDRRRQTRTTPRLEPPLRRRNHQARSPQGNFGTNRYVFQAEASCIRKSARARRDVPQPRRSTNRRSFGTKCHLSAAPKSRTRFGVPPSGGETRTSRPQRHRPGNHANAALPPAEAGTPNLRASRREARRAGVSSHHSSTESHNSYWKSVSLFSFTKFIGRWPTVCVHALACAQHAGDAAPVLPIEKMYPPRSSRPWPVDRRCAAAVACRASCSREGGGSKRKELPLLAAG